MSSPTQRTLKLLRKCGYLCAVVEKWNAHAGIRQDLFGFADIIAVHRFREPRMLLIQATGHTNVAGRLAKVKPMLPLRIWLGAGGAFEVWGWNGKKLRRVIVTERTLAGVPVELKHRRRIKQAEQKGLFA
jgi:hypothetical protein